MSLLEGGEAFNKVPAVATAVLLFRLADPVAEVRRRAQATLESAAPGLVVQWEDATASERVEGLDAPPGAPTGVAAFNTDLPYFGWSPRRRFLVGPGSIHQAHRDPVDGSREEGEWIRKADQEEGARLYLRLIEAELPV
jgi:hypothetical protein